MSDLGNWLLGFSLILLMVPCASLLRVLWSEANDPPDPKVVEVLRLLQAEPHRWRKSSTPFWRGPGSLDLYRNPLGNWELSVGGVHFHTASSLLRPIDYELRREIWAMEQRHAEYMLDLLRATR